VKADPIYEGEWFTFIPITLPNGRAPFRDFCDRLSPRERVDALVAMQIVEDSFRIDRPEAGPRGRFEKVKGVRSNLYELRITPRGRRGRRLSACFVIAAREVFLTHGFAKTAAGLTPGEISRALRILEGWRDDRDGAKT
jgi:hypothetical protein